MAVEREQISSLREDCKVVEEQGVVSKEGHGHPMRNLVIEIPIEQGDDDVLMKDTFVKYTAKGGMMDIQGLWRCMHDFGLLDGRSAQESRDAVVAMFTSLDVRKRNCINVKEFEMMWAKINAPRLGDVISKEDPDLEHGLFEAFCAWSTFGSPKGSQARRRDDEIMGSSHWNKLCRDVGFLPHGGHARSSQTISFSDVDIMFAKVKARGRRKINFSQFIDALGLVAEKLGGMDVMDVVRMIVQSKPSLNGTVVSTPTFCPSTARYNIFKKELLVSPKTVLNTCSTKGGEIPPSARVVTCTSQEEMLLHVYGQYARFGHRQRFNTMSEIQMSMSDQQFGKLCRECGITSKAMPPVKVDLIFAKAKKTGRNSLMFEDFLVALSMIASEQGTKEEAIHALVCNNTAGPQVNSPTAIHAEAFVRLHDDPSTQCGVYGRRNQCIR